MLLPAKVKNGVIILDDDRKLPEGTTVTVAIPDVAADAADGVGTTLYERLKNVVGKAAGGPPDGSINVDHYLYGQPKR